MLHLETQTSLVLPSMMPLSTRVVFPVVSALEQISLSPVHDPAPPLPSLQSEDMITDKEQPALLPFEHEVSVCEEPWCVRRHAALVE